MRRTLRAFVAIELPPEMRSQSLALIERLRPTPARVNWATVDQLHWTLKFLGDVDLNDVPEICSRVASAAARIEPFDIEAFGAGAFPDVQSARTVWLGMRGGAEAMIALHDEVERELSQMGFRAEQRRFRPHLTLGRVRGASGLTELAQKLIAEAACPGGISTLYELVVLSSEQGPKGPVYEPLGHADLGG